MQQSVILDIPSDKLKLQALIDADLVCYRCAASAENDSVDIAILRVDKLMQDLLENTRSDRYRAFLTGGNNFRKEIDPEYKANRRDTVPPQHLQTCREFLVREWKAEVQDGIEADDALGINQTEETIVCSLDKDLLQVPGKHYRWYMSGPNWEKQPQFLEIKYLDGLRHFYSSSLIGDKSDNIFGVQGIGPVKAKKALQDSGDEQSMFDRCRALYSDDDRFFKNLKLLWIMREPEDVFDPEKRGLIV